MPEARCVQRWLGAAVAGLLLATSARAQPAPEADAVPTDSPALLRAPTDAPLGFTGPSSVLPREGQENSDSIPVEDRWRIGLPPWDRYGKGHPPVDDYPYAEGHWWDPFNQNVFKGDYPILGQNTFLDLTAESLTTLDARQVPTQTTPFESTARPHEFEFFGRPVQLFYNHNFSFSVALFHGDAAFKPPDRPT